MRCTLCESENTIQLDSIPVAYVIESYLKLFKTDFSYLFNEENIILHECAHCDLKFYSPIVTGDDTYYNTLQKNDWYYRSEKEEYNYGATYVKKDDAVLDVGCGNGAFAKYIPHAHFTGLEYSTDATKAGEQNGILIINESIETYAINNTSKYDVITMFQVLEHVSNLRAFIKSAEACLKPGGKLVIAVPSEESYLRFRSNAILNMPPHHTTRWSDKSLAYIANEFNLNLVNIHHEKLESVHKIEFLATFFERCMRLNLSQRAPLVDRSSSSFIRRNIAYRMAHLFQAREINNSFLPIGQTVIAVYQK